MAQNKTEIKILNTNYKNALTERKKKLNEFSELKVCFLKCIFNLFYILVFSLSYN